MSQRRRLTRRMIVSAFVALTAFAVVALVVVGKTSTARGDRKPAEDDEALAFVRPYEPKGTPSEVLDDLGIKWVSFRYRIPDAHKLVLTFVARDENGNLIEEFTSHSRTIAFRANKPIEGVVRLTVIDAREFVEGYDGRARWMMRFAMGGAEFSDRAWTANPLTIQGGGGSNFWGQVKTLDEPGPGKDHVIWSCGSRRPSVRDKNGLRQPGPTVFHFEIRFRYEPMTPNDGEGTETFTYRGND